DVAGLSQLGQEFCFSVRAWQPRLLRGAPISSSRIRSLLAAGEISHARALLGRSYSIRSTPASGRGYGTRYAVPTINLAPYPELLPANGVYVTTLQVGDTPSNIPTDIPGNTPNPNSAARLFRGVTNIGNRPTFGADSFAVETHLFDFEPVDLTESTPLTLTFLHRLREERRFPSPELLRTQIGHDIRKAHRLFSLADHLHIPLEPKASSTL
ncbi:MAG TPA: riboflavin kinase, partial [Acidobacteriaceae bacterium]|nr:riboflavin kinase [Acidobacteriaceae bacterium]